MVALKGVLRNIDEKIELQQELQYQITHDALTEIYNRSYFEHKMTEFNEQKDASVAIILCDLDELKYVNDNFGHHEGDRLIKETAKLLNLFSSENVTVSRVGGDEFVLIIVDKSENQVKQLVMDIQKEGDICNLDSYNIQVKISLGYSYSSISLGKMEELLSLADENMYIDKMNRKQLSLQN